MLKTKDYENKSFFLNMELIFLLCIGIHSKHLSLACAMSCTINLNKLRNIILLSYSKYIYVLII